jgi:hypothetical protein
MEDLERTQVLPPIADEGWPDAEPEHAEGNGQPPPGSVLAALQAQRAEHQAVQRVYDLAVPGYRGLLVLRLGPVPASQLSRIMDRATTGKSPERSFNANADLLVAACTEVLARARTSDPFVPLLGRDDEPVKLDARLAELLQLPETRARGLVRALFEGANSPDMALATAAGEYAEWASGAAEEELEESLGN